MFSSRIHKTDIILSIYRDRRTAFRLTDVALLTGETNFNSLNSKLNYYVRTGKLIHPRKGIYAKPDYNSLELACILYTPSYISLEYVLRKAGIVFQYDPGISAVSYLSRNIQVGTQAIRYRKIRGEILVDTAGIIRGEDFINIASLERAFLDLIYLDGNTWFDNLNPLDRTKVFNLLPLYQSKILSERVAKIL